MDLKSSKKDVELPLLTKSNQKQTPNEQSYTFSSLKENQPQSLKYFNINIFSRIVFGWVNAFIYGSKDRTFQQEHHYGLREEEDSGYITNKFLNEWEKVKDERFPLLKTQYRAFKSMIWISFCLALLETLFSFSGPLLVSRIVKYIQNQDQEYDFSYGIVLVVLFVLSRVGTILASSQNGQYLVMIQNRMMKGTLSLVYKKSLQFPLMRNHDISAGNIMNYMMVDVENMSKIFYLLPQLLQIPLLFTIGIGIIYTSAGAAFIGGGIALVVSTLMISFLSKIMFKYQKKVMETKDTRMKKTNEILSGIKYVKMCGAENKFLESVKKDRENELYWIRMKNILEAFRVVTFWFSPVLINICLFGSFVLAGGTLTPATTFVLLSTVNVIQVPINNIGTVFNDLLQGHVSLQRLEKFMFSEDIDTSYITKTKDTAKDIAIKIKNGNFYWASKKTDNGNQEKEQEDFTNPNNLILKNINMEIKKGSFVAILGDVGSGKSSLFNSLLGEMSYDQSNPPSIEINGDIVYMAQKPWILNATIKENIIFDKEYDETTYQEALRTSCLQSDLKTLIKKDNTEIGEKGVNLSGGQKARVALARAIYTDRDIYLMDDPLSAVDAHVAKYILEECLSKRLKDKTRVLVTHKLESLKYVDYIYIFKLGEIVAQGNYEEIKQTSYFQEIEENANKEAKEEEDTETLERKASSKSNNEKQNQEASTRKSQRKETSYHEGKEQKEIMEKLMLNEDRQTGAVTWTVWKSFFGYFESYLYLVGMLAAILFWLGFRTSTDFWLAHWSNNAETDTEHGNSYYYGIFVTFTLSSIVLLFCRMAMGVLGCLGVSKKLHTDMFSRIIRAPINLFFDRVPIGRLLNRFSSDLNVVDLAMPFAICRISLPFDIVWKMILCGVVGTMWVIPLACTFVWVCFRLQKRYFSVYREAFRLSRITSSPVTSMVAESLDGLSQIRSLECQEKFLQKLSLRQNENMKNLILISGLQGWFSFRINLSSLLVVIPTISAAILLSRHTGSSAGVMGLLVTYLLDLSGLVTFALYQYSSFESNLISFERCKAFTNVDVENNPNTRLPVANYSYTWPERGEIEFRNYYAKYRPNLPNVLKDLSFKISGQVGVVGRTGSGKSTTLLSLLRIIEPQAGQIFIDGVDISQIGLDDLRKKITIIPQDPLLYKGSLRANLDLHSQYSDQEIWRSLEKVCMKEKFQQSGLDFEIKEGGENLSAGEKQLLCIARAILNKNKIILIDEATSSIDNVTEEIILESIRENFKDCTMITIAHRLKTIIESDRILFMSDGKVVEFDTPKNLLKDKNGHFYALWKEYEAAKA